MTALAPAVTSARPARPRLDARRQGWVRRAPLLPALVFTIIVTQLPFLVTLYYSLESWSLVRPGSQHFAGLTNYLDVFKDSQFRQTAVNTVIMTGGTVIIAMVIGVALALVLDRKFGFQRAAVAFRARQQLRQMMIALRAAHDIAHRGAADDLLAFGLRDTAGHCDAHGAALARGFVLGAAQAPQFRVDFLRGLFADVTGVENHQICVIHACGLDKAFRR